MVDPLERKEVASFAGLRASARAGRHRRRRAGVRESQTEGLLEFNTDSNAVVRGEGEGVPIPTNSGVAVDRDGLVYAIEAGACDPGRPGFAHVLDQDLVSVRVIQLGRCSAGAQVVRIGVEAAGGQ